MAVDLWPYSGRSGGAVTDVEHEYLWSGWADGVLPGQDSSAGLVQTNAGQWVCYAGRILVAGHVLNLDTAQYGALPPNGTATRTSIVVAYVDHSQSPWQYGVQLVIGSPGGGRPALSKSRTGLYQVPLRAMTTTPAGTTTLLSDERVILQPAGENLVRATAPTGTTVPATITGADGQSTGLLWVRQSPTGPYVFAVSQDGHLGLGDAGGASDTAGIRVKPARNDAVGLRIDAAGAQSADLLQAYNAAGTFVAGIDKSGNIRATNIDLTDWASYTPVVNQGGGATYSTRSGRWKRIAKKTVAVNIQIIVGVAGTTASPNVTISLPTAPSRAVRQTLSGHSEGPSYVLQGLIAQGGSGVNIDAILYSNATTTANITGNDLDPGMIITLSGIYEEA